MAKLNDRHPRPRKNGAAPETRERVGAAGQVHDRLPPRIEPVRQAFCQRANNSHADAGGGPAPMSINQTGHSSSSRQSNRGSWGVKLAASGSEIEITSARAWYQPRG